MAYSMDYIVQGLVQNGYGSREVVIRKGNLFDIYGANGNRLAASKQTPNKAQRAVLKRSNLFRIAERCWSNSTVVLERYNTLDRKSDEWLFLDMLADTYVSAASSISGEYYYKSLGKVLKFPEFDAHVGTLQKYHCSGLLNLPPEDYVPLLGLEFREEWKVLEGVASQSVRRRIARHLCAYMGRKYSSPGEAFLSNDKGKNMTATRLFYLLNLNFSYGFAGNFEALCACPESRPQRIQLLTRQLLGV